MSKPTVQLVALQMRPIALALRKAGFMSLRSLPPVIYTFKEQSK